MSNCRPLTRLILQGTALGSSLASLGLSNGLRVAGVWILWAAGQLDELDWSCSRAAPAFPLSSGMPQSVRTPKGRIFPEVRKTSSMTPAPKSSPLNPKTRNASKR